MQIIIALQAIQQVSSALLLLLPFPLAEYITITYQNKNIKKYPKFLLVQGQSTISRIIIACLSLGTGCFRENSNHNFFWANFQFSCLENWFISLCLSFARLKTWLSFLKTSYHVVSYCRGRSSFGGRILQLFHAAFFHFFTLFVCDIFEAPYKYCPEANWFCK